MTRGMAWPLRSVEEGEERGRQISQAATAASDDGGFDKDGGRAGNEKSLAHKDGLEVELTRCADGSDVF